MERSETETCQEDSMFSLARSSAYTFIWSMLPRLLPAYIPKRRLSGFQINQVKKKEKELCTRSLAPVPLVRLFLFLAASDKHIL